MTPKEDIQVGRALAHYEIVERIGQGGMGTVYRARDLRLGRFVALKVLDVLGGDADRKLRFVQEARAASALNHPNIVTIHEIATDDEIDFIVMELVSGATLDHRLAGRPLALDHALGYALQLTSALAAAHGAGILHRDLKPANIMVTEDGLVKVLDFGLAKLVAPEAASPNQTRTEGPHTAAGVLLGTVAYMSPEQVDCKPLDARSDLFSFGAVLYEMLAGRRAFQGDSPISTLAAILRDEPPLLLQLEPALPPALDAIVRRCLRKEPTERFASAHEVRRSLEQVQNDLRSGPRAAVGPRTEAMPSIAVLPFANLSADRENEYFSDGLAEEIIGALSRLEGVRVTARTSSFVFRGKEQDVRRIGEILNVRTILEGSVRRAGNRIRVHAQLVDATAGFHLWSERYDRELTDVFAIQDEISAAIVERLRIRLARESRPAARPAARSPEAYTLCLKGRYHVYKLTPEELAKGKECFERAAALDPSLALSHHGLASFYWLAGYWGSAPPREVFPAAKAHALRAIELDDELAEAHATLGLILALYDYDWGGAERELRRGIELKPSAAEPRAFYSFLVLRPQGRFEEAVAELERALESDPLAVAFQAQLAALHFFKRHYREAARIARAAIEVEPAHYLPYLGLAMALSQMGEHDEAIAACRKARALNPTNAAAAGLLGQCYALAGRIDEARAAAVELESIALERYVPPSSPGYLYATLGDADRAFEYAARAVEARDPLILSFKNDPRLDRIRSDPRFRALLGSMRLDEGEAS